LNSEVISVNLLICILGFLHMPSINTASSGHTGPAANSGWQWLTYTNTIYLATLQRAIKIIDTRIKGNQPCDKAFKALPGGKSFAQIWADASVWISYDPDNSGHKYGATLRSIKEVTISQFSLKMGHWTVAATLVHELAHVNGAPGGASHAAEGTLKHCLLPGLEDPTIMGMIRRVPLGTRLA
jgi:hypothetical protein